MNSLFPQILTVKKVLEKNLVIPAYQRPYKWTDKHTQQLLEDLLLHFGKKLAYRLGSIVIHQDGELENIVDGQQRLTTLAILLYCLDENDKVNSKLLNQKIKVSKSKENLLNNKEIIIDFIHENIKNKQDFKTYILEKCEFVYIPLNDIDEAFQFFDSQNARGKSLAPYDLLKAYHLRELKADKETVHRCVENWENAVEAKIANLNTVISKTLFRLRRWSRLESAERFLKKDIHCFKGVSQENKYPYLTGIKVSNLICSVYPINPFLINHFQTNQVLINGKVFFDYIENYCQMYLWLFDPEKGYLNTKSIKDIFSDDVISKNKEQGLIDFLNSYSGSDRKGDKYIRCLFECAVLRYYDKFGEEKLDFAIKRSFEWAYRIRLELKSIYFKSIENESVNPRGLLFHLEKSETTKEFFKYTIEKVKDVRCQSAKDIENLLNKGK